MIKLRKKEKFTNVESIIVSILGRGGKLKNSILYSLVEKGKTKRESRIIIKNMNFDESTLEKPVSRITGKLLIMLTKELEKLKNIGEI